MRDFRTRTACVLVLLLCAAAPVHAVMDIKDRGPVLNAGKFTMRVTNVGMIGNAFFDVGLSSDPSCEFPSHSGRELLNYASLWVGADLGNEGTRVSGGPLLEWRPTLDPEDRVRTVWSGSLGTRRLFDDDGDGRVDEEELDGKDDDGDNEVDEDLGMISQQLLTADYVDDRPEALHYIYEGGESHRPLELSVHQEVYGWGQPGYDGIAGLQFRITNHGTQTLKNLYVGMFADLDVRARNDRTGHLDDRVIESTFSRTIGQGSSLIRGSGLVLPFGCTRTLSRIAPVVVNGRDPSTSPRVTVVPLDHTIDPLALIDPYGIPHARAPGQVSFRSMVFERGLVPGQGGVPASDRDRYAALAGSYEGVRADRAASRSGDYTTLVSCGPFATLAPGQSIEFAAALAVGDSPDSLGLACGNAIFLQRGTTLNLLPDTTGADPFSWNEGYTGLTGHEACVEAPAGVTFVTDPHCPRKFDEPNFPGETFVTYRHGTCVWTDADCDACTGFNGRETMSRWIDPGSVPPSPTLRVVPLDHAVRLDWDNLPEVLIGAGLTGVSGSRFAGYRIYKLADWQDRASLLPSRERWAAIANVGPRAEVGEIPLAQVTDSTVEHERILFRSKVYPPGRYTYLDSQVLNGFDYAYAVTTVTEVWRFASLIAVHESPFAVTFDRRVVPHAAAEPKAGAVWVVPNPFRANAAWDRPPVSGDALTRHIDFMGLPRARCTIKIWTVAGDLVAEVEHDGSGGNGEAPWDLVSRNGQDIESGIYLFTVDSTLGTQIGRFVVIR